MLRDEGIVDARQGFGWFVHSDLLRQRLGRLSTIEGQLAASGITAERQILDFAFVAADARVQRVLGTSQVLRVRRLNLADGEPFAGSRCGARRRSANRLSRADVERSPFYELLPVPLGGAIQTIAAEAAPRGSAKLLGVPAGSPVLRCERVTTNQDGQPVLMSVHVFPGHRTEFVVDLPRTEPSIAPTGLRLVE